LLEAVAAADHANNELVLLLGGVDEVLLFVKGPLQQVLVLPEADDAGFQAPDLGGMGVDDLLDALLLDLFSQPTGELPEGQLASLLGKLGP
jgi:hypothetical protein